MGVFSLGRVRGFLTAKVVVYAVHEFICQEFESLARDWRDGAVSVNSKRISVR